jgi:L-iditol 2-dehydrogenase
VTAAADALVGAAGTMTVARLHGPGDIRLADEPQPAVPEGASLVRVDAVGICGSDLHWFTEGSIGDAQVGSPLVLGHEMGGTIAAGPRRGQRVAIDPSIPCWQCEPCRAGHPNLCLHIVFAGHGSTDGGLRQFLAWPGDRLHPVPDSFDGVTTAMLEPLGVALHALDLAHVGIAGAVAIVGCGPIGLLAVQLARLAGAHTIVAVDPRPHRRALAAELGADHGCGVDDAADVVQDATRGHGVDVAVEIAGTDDAVDLAMLLVRAGGRVVLAGIPDGDRTSFTASTARRKGLTIAMSRRMKEVYPRAIALVDSAAVDVRSVVSDEFPLSEVGAAFHAAVTRRGHKVIVTP